jgi:predicted double-glycine peptidase
MIKIRPVEEEKLAYCGPACLQAVLDHFGVRVSQTKLAKESGTTLKSGTPNSGIIKVIQKYGLRAVVKENSTTFKDIHKYVVGKKAPVIVDWFSAYEHPANGHYSVVVDINKTHISLFDPEIKKIRKVPLKEFVQLWFDFDGDIALDKLPLKMYFRWMTAVLPPDRQAL